MRRRFLSETTSTHIGAGEEAGSVTLEIAVLSVVCQRFECDVGSVCAVHLKLLYRQFLFRPLQRVAKRMAREGVHFKCFLISHFCEALCWWTDRWSMA